MVDLTRRLGFAAAAAVMAAALLVSTGPRAQDFGEIVTKRGQFDDNVFVAGHEVNVDAEVAGDLVVFGGEIMLGDRIAGDVLAGGGEVRVEGAVSGDVRAAGGKVEVHADIGGDMMAVGGAVLVTQDAKVGGNAWLAGGAVEIDGAILGHLYAGGRDVTINGAVAGDVELTGETLVVGPAARITGDLTYHSLEEADIHPDARIGGDVTFIRSEGPKDMMGGTFAGFGGAGVVFWLGLIVLGAILIGLFPGLSGAATGNARTAFWRTLGLGLAVLVVTPVVLLVLAITIIGLPITIVGAALYVAALFSGYLLAAIGIGQWAARRFRRTGDGAFWPRVGALVAGMVILAIVGLVPVLGALVTLAALMIGLGTVVSAALAARPNRAASGAT